MDLLDRAPQRKVPHAIRVAVDLVTHCVVVTQDGFDQEEPTQAGLGSSTDNRADAKRGWV